MLNPIRTKIVATAGPASQDLATLGALIQAGVNLFRINMAHGRRHEHEQLIANIRRQSHELERTVAVLVDLAGPKIRLGQLAEDPIECKSGEEFRFVRGEQARARDEFVTNYPRMVDELSVGDRVMLADGTISMEVVEKNRDEARCRVLGGGTLRSRQGINLPGVQLSVPSMTDKDVEDAVWAAGSGADFIGLSFVRAPQDVVQLKDLIRREQSPAMVVAKIEKAEALECLDEVIHTADAVMVARGDLGVETDLAETPAVQKRIITSCQQRSKPVIVATQMLDSMQHSTRPTRAEVSDVANAILDGADACMLSGETAIGSYPVQAVAMMSRVMRATERLLLAASRSTPPQAEFAGVHSITAATITGAIEIAQLLDAKLIVIATHGGSTARLSSKHRTAIPVVGVSDRAVILRQMSLFWGVTSLPSAPVTHGPDLRKFVERWGRTHGHLAQGDRVVYLAVRDFITNAHNSVFVQELE